MTCVLQNWVSEIRRAHDVLFDRYASGHHDDDRGTVSTDKPSAQRARKVMARLGRSSDDNQIGVIRTCNPQELRGRVSLSVDECEVDTVVKRVAANLVAQLLGLIDHRLLDCPVGNNRTAKRGRRRGGSRSWTHEHGDGAATESTGFAAGPAEGIPRGIGPVDPDDDYCTTSGASRGVVHLVSLMWARIDLVVLSHELRNDNDRVLRVTHKRDRYRSDNVMVGVHRATDNDDDGRVSTVITAEMVGGGDKLVRDAPVTSLESPTLLNELQPASNRFGELLFEGIETFQHFNQALG